MGAPSVELRRLGWHHCCMEGRRRFGLGAIALGLFIVALLTVLALSAAPSGDPCLAHVGRQQQSFHADGDFAYGTLSQPSAANDVMCLAVGD
jgi:hypothetical protein